MVMERIKNWLKLLALWAWVHFIRLLASDPDSVPKFKYVKEGDEIIILADETSDVDKIESKESKKKKMKLFQNVEDGNKVTLNKYLENTTLEKDNNFVNEEVFEEKQMGKLEDDESLVNGQLEEEPEEKVEKDEEDDIPWLGVGRGTGLTRYSGIQNLLDTNNTTDEPLVIERRPPVLILRRDGPLVLQKPSLVRSLSQEKERLSEIPEEDKQSPPPLNEDDLNDSDKLWASLVARYGKEEDETNFKKDVGEEKSHSTDVGLKQQSIFTSPEESISSEEFSTQIEERLQRYLLKMDEPKVLDDNAKEIDNMEDEIDAVDEEAREIDEIEGGTMTVDENGRLGNKNNFFILIEDDDSNEENEENFCKKYDEEIMSGNNFHEGKFEMETVQDYKRLNAINEEEESVSYIDDLQLNSTSNFVTNAEDSSVCVMHDDNVEYHENISCEEDVMEEEKTAIFTISLHKKPDAALPFKVNEKKISIVDHELLNEDDDAENNIGFSKPKGEEENIDNVDKTVGLSPESFIKERRQSRDLWKTDCEKFLGDQEYIMNHNFKKSEDFFLTTYEEFPEDCVAVAEGLLAITEKFGIPIDVEMPKEEDENSIIDSVFEEPKVLIDNGEFDVDATGVVPEEVMDMRDEELANVGIQSDVDSSSNRDINYTIPEVKYMENNFLAANLNKKSDETLDFEANKIFNIPEVSDFCKSNLTVVEKCSDSWSIVSEFRKMKIDQEALTNIGQEGGRITDLEDALIENQQAVILEANGSNYEIEDGIVNEINDVMESENKELEILIEEGQFRDNNNSSFDLAMKKDLSANKEDGNDTAVPLIEDERCDTDMINEMFANVESVSLSKHLLEVGVKEEPMVDVKYHDICEIEKNVATHETTEDLEHSMLEKHAECMVNDLEELETITENKHIHIIELIEVDKSHEEIDIKKSINNKETESHISLEQYAVPLSTNKSSKPNAFLQEQPPAEQKKKVMAKVKKGKLDNILKRFEEKEEPVFRIPLPKKIFEVKSKEIKLGSEEIENAQDDKLNVSSEKKDNSDHNVSADKKESMEEIASVISCTKILSSLVKEEVEVKAVGGEISALILSKNNIQPEIPLQEMLINEVSVIQGSTDTFKEDAKLFKDNFQAVGGETSLFILNENSSQPLIASQQVLKEEVSGIQVSTVTLMEEKKLFGDITPSELKKIVNIEKPLENESPHISESSIDSLNMCKKEILPEIVVPMSIIKSEMREVYDSVRIINKTDFESSIRQVETKDTVVLETAITLADAATSEINDEIGLVSEDNVTMNLPIKKKSHKLSCFEDSPETKKIIKTAVKKGKLDNILKRFEEKECKPVATRSVSRFDASFKKPLGIKSNDLEVFSSNHILKDFKDDEHKTSLTNIKSSIFPVEGNRKETKIVFVKEQAAARAEVSDKLIEFEHANSSLKTFEKDSLDLKKDSLLADLESSTIIFAEEQGVLPKLTDETEAIADTTFNKRVLDEAICDIGRSDISSRERDRIEEMYNDKITLVNKEKSTSLLELGPEKHLEQTNANDENYYLIDEIKHQRCLNVQDIDDDTEKSHWFNDIANIHEAESLSQRKVTEREEPSCWFEEDLRQQEDTSSFWFEEDSKQQEDTSSFWFEEDSKQQKDTSIFWFEEDTSEKIQEQSILSEINVPNVDNAGKKNTQSYINEDDDDLYFLKNAEEKPFTEEKDEELALLRKETMEMSRSKKIKKEFEYFDAKNLKSSEISEEDRLEKERILCTIRNERELSKSGLIPEEEIPDYLDDVKDLLVPKIRRKKGRRSRVLDDIMKLDDPDIIPKVAESNKMDLSNKPLNIEGVSNLATIGDNRIEYENSAKVKGEESEHIVGKLLTEQEESELVEIRREQEAQRCSQRKELEKYLSMPAALTEQEQQELEDLLDEEENDRSVNAASAARLEALLNEVRKRIGDSELDLDTTAALEEYIGLPIGLTEDEERLLSNVGEEKDRSQFANDDEYREYIKQRYLDELEDERLRVEEDEYEFGGYYEDDYEYDGDEDYGDELMEEDYDVMHSDNNPQTHIMKDEAVGSDVPMDIETEEGDGVQLKKSKKLLSSLSSLRSKGSKSSSGSIDSSKDGSITDPQKDSSNKHSKKFFRYGGLSIKRKKKSKNDSLKEPGKNTECIGLNKISNNNVRKVDRDSNISNIINSDELLIFCLTENDFNKKEIGNSDNGDSFVAISTNICKSLTNLCDNEIIENISYQVSKMSEVTSGPDAMDESELWPEEEDKKDDMDEFQKMEQEMEKELEEEQTKKKKSDTDKRGKKKKKRKGESEKENKKTAFQSKDELYEKHVGPRVRSFDAAKMKSKFNKPKEPTQVSNDCRICGKQVFQMEKIVAEKASWHKNCFRCIECNKNLTLETYQSHEGSLYCKPHFKELFRPKAVILDEAEERKDRLLRRPRMIILESQPDALPDDVVRATNKPDYGLEELQTSLNVKERFAVFENYSKGVDEPKLEPASVRRSQSLMSKAARFSNGHENGDFEGDDEEFESGEEGWEEEKEGDEEDPNYVKSRKKKERPMSFSGMGDLKAVWEQKQRREEMSQARKEDISKFRQMLCAGKNITLKEMFESGNFEGADEEEKQYREEIKIEERRAAHNLKARFEKGQPFILEDEEGSEDGSRTSTLIGEKQEVEEVFKDAQTAKQARNVFKQIDTKVSQEGSAVLRSPSFATQNRDNRRSLDISLMMSQKSTPTVEVVKSSEPIEEELQMDTTDLANRFKFFATFEEREREEKEKKRKVFRITPPREGAEQVEDELLKANIKPCMAPNCTVCKLRGLTQGNDNLEVLGRNPNLIKCTDNYQDEIDCRNTKNILQMFKKMEMGQEDLDDEGPRPLKCFTPPPEDGEGDYSEYSDEDYSDEGEDDESEDDQGKPKFKDELLEMEACPQSAKKAANLRAKFEKWEAEVERQNELNRSKDGELTEECRPSLDTARNLKAMFEHKAIETTKPVTSKPVAQKINRFVGNGEKCMTCNKTVYAMEKLEIHGKILHKNCFKCFKCNTRLSVGSFSIGGDQMFCTTHYKQLFTEKGSYNAFLSGKDKWTSKIEATNAEAIKSHD